MFKFSFVALSGLTMLVGVDQSAVAAAKAPTFYVGTCKPGKADFTTIQGAVSAVPPGSTIDVCPGVYPEQVTITQPLTLQGVQSGNNAQVMITAPPGGTLLATVPVSVPIVAQVAVQNSGGAVDISGVTIDGTGITGSSPPITGILYNSSAGTLNQVAVQNLSPNAFSVGITFRDDFAASPTNSVQNSTVTFPHLGPTFSTGIAATTQINGPGTTVSGGTITLSITNNYIGSVVTGMDIESNVATTITGNALDGLPISNGQMFSFNGTGISMFANSSTVKINNNSVRNFADGVLLENALTQSAVTISNNTIASSDAGVNLFAGAQGGTVTINSNQIITPASVTPQFGRMGFNFGCQPPLPTIAGNTIFGAQIGLANVPSGSSLQKNVGTFINVPNVEQLCQ